MVQFGMFPLHPFLPRVHWDGMDSRNAGMGGGTVWDVPILSHDGMGWDGMDSRYSEQDHLGYSHFDLMDMTKGTHRMGYPSTVGRL